MILLVPHYPMVMLILSHEAAAALFVTMTCSYPNLSVLPLLYITFSCLYFTIQPSWTSLRHCVLQVGVLQVGGDVVLGVDCLPNQDSALLIGAGLSDTTAYQATVYRLSVGPIREDRKRLPSDSTVSLLFLKGITPRGSNYT